MTKPRLGMKGNGCAGSIASGVSTGKICSREFLIEPNAVFGATERSARPRRCRHRRSSRAQLDARSPADRRSARSPCASTRASCCAGVSPSSRERGDAGIDHALQAGDAHHVEFVEVRRRDRQKAQALQQRMAQVLRLLQNAAVEGEPGQFAVDEAAPANWPGWPGSGPAEPRARASASVVGGASVRRNLCRLARPTSRKVGLVMSPSLSCPLRVKDFSASVMDSPTDARERAQDDAVP